MKYFSHATGMTSCFIDELTINFLTNTFVYNHIFAVIFLLTLAVLYV